MAQETEIKLRVPSAAAARRLLSRHGFTVTQPRHFERNVVLDTASSALRQQGQLLRVRQAAGQTIITFKGPRVTGAKHKTREELETTAGSFAALIAILERLGLRPGFQYEKCRTEFARPREKGHAVLDETPIGTFLELEGSPAWIDRTARRLGFAASHYLLESYGALWAAHCSRHALAPGADFVFPAAAKKRSAGRPKKRRRPSK